MLKREVELRIPGVPDEPFAESVVRVGRSSVR